MADGMFGDDQGGQGLALEAAVLRLSKLLSEENDALAAMDFGRAGGLLAAKHAAADALAAAWRAADSTDLVSDSMRKLGELAEENRRLLKHAMRVQRRVLDLVAKAARTAPSGGRYAAGGKAVKAPGGARSFKTRA